MKKFKVSVVVPAYNEAQNLPRLVEELTPILSLYPDYEIILVDDGSTDNTLNVIKALRRQNSKVQYLSFSRNFGHQYALKAGLDHAGGDCVISMDADLQHPPHLIPELVRRWQNGYDIVYTQRRETANESWFKRVSSRLFYRLLRGITGLQTPQGAADFRLLDRRVVEALKSAPEKVLFLRGFISWLGFRQIGIDYTPAPRFAGQSHYTLGKMLALALTGITSFTVKPLRLATWLGMLVCLLGVCYALYAVSVKIFYGDAISGWTSLLITMLILGGTQLFMMGIFGEYLGTIFIESKCRPAYLLRENSLIKGGELPPDPEPEPAIMQPAPAEAAPPPAPRTVSLWHRLIGSRWLPGLLLGLAALWMISALLTNTAWLFGDDYLFMLAMNGGGHSPLIFQAGRFYPLGFAEFNLLWLLPDARTIFAHDLVVACMIAAVFFVTFRLYQTVNAAAERPAVFGWSALAAVAAMIMTPAFTQIFLNIVYPEKMVILFLSLFALFYFRAVLYENKRDYLLALGAAVIATYCKEPVFGVFWIIAAVLLIFGFRRLTRADKYFCAGLFLNGLLFLLLYYFLTAETRDTLYFVGKNQGAYLDLALKMLTRNKIIALFLVVALWRFVSAIVYPQDRRTLAADSLIYAACGYFMAYVALKLQDNYYLTPVYVLGLPAVYYDLRRRGTARLFVWGGWIFLFAVSVFFTSPHPWKLVSITHQVRGEHRQLLSQLVEASLNGRQVDWYYPSPQGNNSLRTQKSIAQIMTRFVTGNQARNFRVVTDISSSSRPGKILVISDFLKNDRRLQNQLRRAVDNQRLRLRSHIWNLRLFEPVTEK